MKKFTLEEDLEPIISGKVEVPNIEDIDPIRFLNNLASGGHSLVPKWGRALINGRKNWAQFFMTPAGMGGRLDGGGYVVVWGNTAPVVARFAICKHEKVDGPGANHSRGWHPGSCKHCGLDMTVDSGD
jgi:hypothetical protein